jgi:hypothetical protein
MDDRNPYRSPDPPSADETGHGRDAGASDHAEALAGRLTTIATYYVPIQAELARSRLEADGIPAFIEGGEFASMAWHLLLANQGIKVQVPTEDAERAAALLKVASQTADHGHADEGGPEADANEAEDDDGGPADEPPPTGREQNADRAFRGAVIGLLFLPLQLYVFWLLLKVFISEEPLSERLRNRAFVAAAINLPLIVVLGFFARSLFR